MGKIESVFWWPSRAMVLGAAFSHAFAGELEAVGVVDEAIENGVRDGGVPNGSMPGVQGELARDDGGAAAVAVLEDSSRSRRSASVSTDSPQSSKIRS
ncbi:hypothetical protein XH97_02970 [Bradyrhizobium sp. CCBAU 53380]|nr:hypothetical protein [Bradyrhizobium sp. CCBAU 53380]